jgi:hypothetical protein
MPRNKRLRHGVGANISVYKKFLHPRSSHFWIGTPNVSKNDMLDDLIVIGQQEENLCPNVMQTCVLMRHADFDDGQILLRC